MFVHVPSNFCIRQTFHDKVLPCCGAGEPSMVVCYMDLGYIFLLVLALSRGCFNALRMMRQSK